MTLKSVRQHLQAFSIVRKRRTTIAHAFASAIAPADTYDEGAARRAVEYLGMSDENFRCVYCDEPAQTWDHLVGLVSGGRFSGHGHVLGNLVPCCKACNSSKGNQDWSVFIKIKWPGPDTDARVGLIAGYQKEFGMPGIPYETIRALAPGDIALYEELHREVMEKLFQADAIAARIRATLAGT